MQEQAKVGAIGRPTRRLEGRDKTMGRVRYVGDLRFAGMLHARLVLSVHAHARIVSISTAEAERRSGVVACLTAASLPVARRHPIAGPLASEEVFFVGQPVAVVVAESAQAAEDAAELVVVDYQPLGAVTELESAMADGSILVGPQGAVVDEEAAGIHGAAVASQGEDDRPIPRNCADHVIFKRGDVESALNGAAYRLQDTYTIPAAHQGYLETQGCVAQPEGSGRVVVHSSTQGQFFVREEVAKVLGLAPHQVRVVGTAVGGGFGGKFGLIEPLVAAVALAVGQPVSLIYTRSEDFAAGNPAPAARIDLEMSVDHVGNLTAIRANLIFDAGARPSGSGSVGTMLLASTYRCPNLDVFGGEVLTHKLPTGPYRGPGAPQAYFALESHIDRLAAMAGLDPLDLRLRNAVREGDLMVTGDRWPTVGLVECLEAVRPHWQARRREPGLGSGLAVGGWIGGLEPMAAACRVESDGSVILQLGSTDLTGSNTVMAQIAAEVFGLPVDRVQVMSGDTDSAPHAGGTGGSKIIYAMGPAVMQAAAEAKRQLLELAADHLEAAVEDLEIADGRVRVRGSAERGIEIGRLASLSTQDGGRYRPIHGAGSSAIAEPSPMFTVHMATVRVDGETGALEVVDYLAIQDVGRALNPAEIAGQIHGGVAQGIGRTLGEGLVYDSTGQPLTTSFVDYGLPMTTDLCAIRTEMVEVASPWGPFGAKGVGEPPAIPVAAAMANAVAAACGARLVDLPFDRAKLIEGASA